MKNTGQKGPGHILMADAAYFEEGDKDLEDDFEGMRNRIYSLFEEVYPVQSKELSGKEETVNTGKVKECISIKETLKELRNTDHPAKVHYVQRGYEK